MRQRTDYLTAPRQPVRESSGDYRFLLRAETLEQMESLRHPATSGIMEGCEERTRSKIDMANKPMPNHYTTARDAALADGATEKDLSKFLSKASGLKSDYAAWVDTIKTDMRQVAGKLIGEDAPAPAPVTTPSPAPAPVAPSQDKTK